MCNYNLLSIETSSNRKSVQVIRNIICFIYIYSKITIGFVNIELCYCELHLCLYTYRDFIQKK